MNPKPYHHQLTLYRGLNPKGDPSLHGPVQLTHQMMTLRYHQRLQLPNHKMGSLALGLNFTCSDRNLWPHAQIFLACHRSLLLPFPWLQLTCIQRNPWIQSVLQLPLTQRNIVLPHQLNHHQNLQMTVYHLQSTRHAKRLCLYTLLQFTYHHMSQKQQQTSYNIPAKSHWIQTLWTNLWHFLGRTEE